MSTPIVWLAIALGGALGAIARHAVSRWMMSLFGSEFPWGTLIVNVCGSTLMGVLIVFLASRESVAPALQAFIMVGLLGAFTTFSTFALDAYVLYERGAQITATVYVATSVVLSVFGLVAGLSIARSIS